MHGVLSAASPDDLRWAREYVTGLRELAPRYGFGFVYGWHKVRRKLWPGEQAGAYLSSYFVKGRGKKAPITENVQADDLPRFVVFISRHLTQASGCTMRNLRNARRIWAWRGGLIVRPGLPEREWDIVVSLLSPVGVSSFPRDG
jgi:hypothetical protein